jgi:hypothetical protein
MSERATDRTWNAGTVNARAGIRPGVPRLLHVGIVGSGGERFGTLR